VIGRHERGHSNSKIGRHIGMPKSTVRNIIKQAREMNGKGKVASAFCGLQLSTRNGGVNMIEIERLLTVWIEDCNQKRTPHNRAATCIQTKALNLFKRAKGNTNELAETFNASFCSFYRFENRVQLRIVKITGEAATANEEAASKYPDVLKN
jgi:hypothetical protein